LIRSYLYRQV